MDINIYERMAVIASLVWLTITPILLFCYPLFPSLSIQPWLIFSSICYGFQIVGSKATALTYYMFVQYLAQYSSCGELGN